TLIALKAIGNAGIELLHVQRQLERCIYDESGFVPIEIRLAAIEAHRRMPFCAILRDELFSVIYQNTTMDPELRIASYLQVMRCADYAIIKMIRRTLQDEDVNQVGSFVWSHLKNTLSSSSPTRIEIQSLLSDRDLNSKFDSDFRKFSRNFGNSFFSEELNFGASHETNVIFSPKSYIPRTVLVNSSLDFLGESINFLEFAIRIEGFEFYAEELFGPGGLLSASRVTGYFNRFARSSRSPVEDLDRKLRGRIEDLPNIIDNNFDHPQLSLSYKIFGNEIKFSKFNDDMEIKGVLADLNPWEKLKQLLRGQEIIDYESAIMLLDTSYVVPTTAGLPVRIDLTSSSACNVKLSGVVDTQRFLSNGELEIDGNFMP
ncbi:hypothetical protein QAD02_007181, partial [Eretmocerus hayati]